VCFLLSMNEVNIKYWFRDFLKKFFYRFSGRIRTFYRRNTDFYEKKNSVVLPSAVISWLSKWKFCPPDCERCFQVRDFSCWIKFLRVALWIFGSFLTSTWNIYQFLGLIWCKILCWTQKNILYGFLSPIERHWSPKTEFVRHEIFISRVIDQKFYAELKKRYFMRSKAQSKVIRAQKRNMLVMKFSYMNRKSSRG
jgi:hypothetical protein